MAPRGCNCHCASCDRIIHDLTALTFDEAAGLLASNEDVYVRAKVGRDGVIALQPGGPSAGRRMIAAAGASFALATAACQTVPEKTAPRYSISGQLDPYLARTIKLRSGERKNSAGPWSNPANMRSTISLPEPISLRTMKIAASG